MLAGTGQLLVREFYQVLGVRSDAAEERSNRPSGAWLSSCIPTFTLQVHLVAYCADLGYSPARGAEMLAVMLGFGVVSRLIFGWVLNRIGGLSTLLLGSTMQAIALALYLPFDGFHSRSFRPLSAWRRVASFPVMRWLSVSCSLPTRPVFASALPSRPRSLAWRWAAGWPAPSTTGLAPTPRRWSMALPGI